MTNIHYGNLMADKPLLLDSIINQFGQKVDFYEDQESGDFAPVIAVINEIAVITDFFDTDDFYQDSEYNPVLIDGKIQCYFNITMQKT